MLTSFARFAAVFLCFLALTGCRGEHENKPKDAHPNGRIGELREAYEAAKVDYAVHADHVSGWPSVTDCDALLWAGLANAGGASVDLGLAEYQPGEYHRRPAPSCWNSSDGDVGSKSTISNDMFTGAIWGFWRARDLAALQRIADYGERHSWIMGKPESLISRVLLKGNTVGLLGRQIYALSGGSDDRSYRSLFEYYSPVGADYERHIQALGIALQGSVNEALRTGSLDATVEPRGEESLSLLDLNDQMMARIRELVATEPSNPLFHAVLGTYTGDFSRAIELLLDRATPVPSYCRSDGGHADAAYWHAERLFAMNLVLTRYANPSALRSEVN